MTRVCRTACIAGMCIAMAIGFAAAAGDTASKSTWTPMPTTTAWGTSGLSQTSSAEALGAGRLNFSGQGAWYQQKTAYPGTPNAGANIATGTGAMAFGVSNYFDVFGGGDYFYTTKYDADKKHGVGTMVAGAQASLPLPREQPVRLGVQGAVLGGLSKNQLNTNYADGYNYFETRTAYDFMGKALESLVFGTECQGFKLHLNQGVVRSTEAGKEDLLLLSGGLQGNIVPFFSIGVEANSRTFLKHRSFRTDPLWITPTIVFRTPAYLAFTLGGDISVAKDRDNAAQRSLEKYRLFGDILLSFDCLEGVRRAAAAKILRDSTERVQCRVDVQRLATARDNLTQRVSSDSLLAIQHKRTSDSLLAVTDSLLRKSRQDSVVLVAALSEARRLLEIEKERRTDAEKKLLSTGMLILDAVYFESGKSDISINSKPYLKLIAKMLERYPKLVLEVGGHTDNVGSAEMNQRLSQTRSEAVRDFLTLMAPGLTGRLSAMGYGPYQPKADNKTAVGRKSNRRVELKVVNPEVLKEYN